MTIENLSSIISKIITRVIMGTNASFPEVSVDHNTLKEPWWSLCLSVQVANLSMTNH